MDSALGKKLDELKRASDRLQLISTHDALVLLRASCSAPKLMHVMRSSPCAGHTFLSDIDNSLRLTQSIITNVNITDEQWRQASFPVKAEGIGVRSVMSIAPSAFLSSSKSIQQLQTLFLNKRACQMSDQHFNNVLDNWCQRHYPVQPPSGTNASKQRSWDMPSVDAIFNSLFAVQPDDYHKARLTVVKAPHSGDWLNALPITSCGLRLEEEAIRVADCLRLCASLCEPNQCTCGNMVNTRSNYGLSCEQSAGRTLRHKYISDLVYYALLQAGLPSTKESAGLLCSIGKWPDGLTNVPWQAGKSAMWDVTAVDTVADSYLASTSMTAAAAAQLATIRKETKYVELSTTHNFVPLAFESLGPIGSKAAIFLKELGRRSTFATDNPLETAHLLQRLSVTLQRFNAVCVLGCFRGKQDDVDLY